MNVDELLKGLHPDDRLLRPKEAAAFLKLSPQTLNVWRHKKKKGLPCPDLPFKRIGRRAIRYRFGDLRAFADQQSCLAANDL